MKQKIFPEKLNLFLLTTVMGLIFLLFTSKAFPAIHLQPSSIIKLPANENLILVEKKTQTLFVYTLKDNELFVRFQASCSTGEVAGIKQEAGDRKTPEGIYFLYDEYEDKYLSPIYGVKAFPTNYPNFIDKKTGKNGSAIWIHGTNKKLKPMDSNGCIAMENRNILKLSNYVSLHSTPVIMVEEIDKINPEILISQEKNISLLLNQWIKAIEKGTYHEFLSFYSSEYLPDITWWEQWLKVRKPVGGTDLSLRVEIDRAGIYYHNHVFVVLFDYFLVFKNKKILLGKKELFLENKNNQYKIIGDTFQKIKLPLIAAAKTLIKSEPDSKKESVIENIKQWLAAWSAKDMDMYAGFYADNFYSDGMNKKNWVKRKKIIAEQYDFINVSGSEFKVKQKGEACEVTFFQDYESSGYTAQGIKKLKLVNKGGLWKIYQESWKKK